MDLIDELQQTTSVPENLNPTKIDYWKVSTVVLSIALMGAICIIGMEFYIQNKLNAIIASTQRSTVIKINPELFATPTVIPTATASPPITPKQ